MSSELFNVASRHRLITPINDDILGDYLTGHSQHCLIEYAGEFENHESQVRECLLSRKMFYSCKSLGHWEHSVWAFKGQLLRVREMVQKYTSDYSGRSQDPPGCFRRRSLLPWWPPWPSFVISLNLRQRGNTGTGLERSESVTGRYLHRECSWEDVRAFVHFFSHFVF